MQLNSMTSPETMVPLTMVTVVAVLEVALGFAISPAVVKSFTLQLQPFGAVAVSPKVKMVVQLVEPTVVNFPAVAPPDEVTTVPHPVS